MPKKTTQSGARVPTVVDDIYAKLAQLLSPTEFRSSAQVIETFEKTFPADWKKLVTRFGHRDETPGKNRRRHYYAASTYVADRLSSMKRMRYLELRYIIDGFDQSVWKHNRRMGSWRLIREPEPASGDWKFVTVRMPGESYDKMAAEVTETGGSVSALAAARGSRACTRHLARLLNELEGLAMALSEFSHAASDVVVVRTQNAVQDAREDLMRCWDCRTRYEELKAMSNATEIRKEAKSATGP